MMDHCKRQQEDSGGNGGQSDQSNINQAMNFLAAAPMLTTRKMFFVVFAHLGREAGNIITPARQNFAYDWINALLTYLGVRNQPGQSPLQTNRLQRFGLGR